MNSHKFTVILHFSDQLPLDEDITEVMNNIMEGLVAQSNSQLAPEDSDVYTTRIEVKNNFSETHLIKDL